ncbi:hypothetical protein Zmor_016711 [Zophobas morio]|uniref:Uncharacterized protein n=1 Tax=Zophobas morio TaxID=2755281 RepID=A0AA38I3V5_9CUCU|nr:hypothetical protein Zmor_016711 [Zophobas morio]
MKSCELRLSQDIIYSLEPRVHLLHFSHIDRPDILAAAGSQSAKSNGTGKKPGGGIGSGTQYVHGKTHPCDHHPASPTEAKQIIISGDVDGARRISAGMKGSDWIG